MVHPRDERPQPPGPEDIWADAWEIDFARDDGVGGFVRLTLCPNLGRAWWWTSLLVPGLVAVRDHDVPLPRSGLEVRGDGLWGELVCETPLEHWSLGLEAFGIGFDDPSDAWGDEWGDRLPVGLDLEWEATAEVAGLPPAGPPAGPGGGGFAQPGQVTGEILVGTARIPFTGSGCRSRSWGLLDWWNGPPHHRLAWHDGAGVGFGAAEPELAQLATTLDASGLPESATSVIGGQARDICVLGVAPLLVTGPGGRSARLARALCRVEAADRADRGVGWAEWLPATGGGR